MRAFLIPKFDTPPCLWQSPTTTCAPQTGYAQIASTEKLTQTHIHGAISTCIYVHMHMPACSAAQFMLAAVAYAQIVAPHYIAQRRHAYSQCRKRARDHINTHTHRHTETRSECCRFACSLTGEATRSHSTSQPAITSRTAVLAIFPCTSKVERGRYRRGLRTRCALLVCRHVVGAAIAAACVCVGRRACDCVSHIRSAIYSATYVHTRRLRSSFLLCALLHRAWGDSAFSFFCCM